MLGDVHMKTAALVNGKGGVGKSTLSINIAVCAAQAGKNVVLFDTDAQGTSMAWARLRQARFGTVAPPPLVIQSSAVLLHSKLAVAFGDGCDLAIIDTAGVDSQDNDRVMRLSDLVVLPCAPSMADIITTKLSYEKADALGQEARILLTKVTLQGSRLAQLQSCLSGLGSRWLPTPLSHRVDHVDSYAAGLGVNEYTPRGPAAAEMLASWAQSASLLDL